MTKVTFVVYLLIRLFIKNANVHIVSEFLWSEYKTYGISITTRMTMKSHLLKTLNCKYYLSFNIVFIPEKAAMSAVQSVKLEKNPQICSMWEKACKSTNELDQLMQRKSV